MFKPTHKYVRTALFVFMVVLGILTLAILAPMTRGQMGNAAAMIKATNAPAATDVSTDFPTETATPTDWWYHDLPSEKRAPFETDMAHRATVMANPNKSPRPTRTHPTTEPIKLTGRPSGIGFLREEGNPPIAKGSWALGSRNWSGIVGNEIIQIFAGSDENNPEQGVVAEYWWSRTGISTRPMRVVLAPIPSGFLEIKGAEDKVIILGSEKGQEFRYNIVSEQFE